MSQRVVLCGNGCGHDHNSPNGPSGCCGEHGLVGGNEVDRVPAEHLALHMATNHDPSETREDHRP